MSNNKFSGNKTTASHHYLNTQKSNAHTKINKQLVQLWFGSATAPPDLADSSSFKTFNGKSLSDIHHYLAGLLKQFNIPSLVLDLNKKNKAGALAIAVLGLGGGNVAYAACGCPAGATEITATSGAVSLATGTDYCISNDLSLSGSITFTPNTTLTIADGVRFDISGSMLQNQSPSEFNICEDARVVMHGSYTQTGNNLFNGTKSLLQLDEHAGLEVCGTWTATPDQFAVTTIPVSNLTGDDPTKHPLIIARSGFSAFGQIGSPNDVVDFINMSASNVQRTSAHEECFAPTTAGDDVSTKTGCSWVPVGAVTIGATAGVCGEINNYPISGPVAPTTGTVSGSVKDATGAAITGVTVKLKDSSGAVIATETTGGSGNYTFSNVPVGEYTIEETDPANYTSTSDTQSSDGDTTANTNANDNSIPVTVIAGETDSGNDFVDTAVVQNPLTIGTPASCTATDVTFSNLVNDGTPSNYANQNSVTFASAGGGSRSMTFTKTAGSDSAGGNSAPLNIAPVAWDPVSGIWMGSDDNYGAKDTGTGLDSETYELSFDAEVTQAQLTFAAMNFNGDGDERIEIIKVEDGTGADVTASTVFAFADNTPAGNGALQLNATTGRIEGTVYGPLTSNGTFGNSNGKLTIDRAAGIQKVVFKRIELDNEAASSKTYPAANRSNGITLGPIAYCLPPVNGTVSGSVKDASGNPVVGAQVKVVDSTTSATIDDTNGNPLTATVNPTTGAYSFSNVPTGDYNIVEIDPSGYVSTADGDSSSDGDANTNASQTDNIIPVTITSGKNDTDNDFVDITDALPVTTNDVDTYTPGVDKDVTIITNDTTGDTIVPASISLVGGTDPDADGNFKTLVVANEGTWTINPTTGVATFAPLGSFTGDPTPPSYTGEDAQGNTSNESTITLTADPLPKTVNDVDTYTTGVDKDVTIITNDTTGDTIVPATILFTTTGIPTATLSADGKTLTVPNEGIWSVNASGVATFAPDASFTGDPTPPSYTGEDAQGNTSNESTITLTADSLPKTVNDVDTYTPGVDKDVTILGNDTTGDTIVPASISLVGGTDPDADGNFKTLVVANEGTWTINPTTGVATFAPLGSFTGDPTPPSYTGEDAQGNTSNESTITLTADPLPKTVNDVDTYTTGVDKDVTIITNDTTGDTIVPSTIQFTTTGIPTATLSADGKRLTVPNEGIWSVNASGMATFAPDASFTGDPTPPSYTGEDAQGNTSNESTITLTADPLPKTVNDVDTYTPGVDKDVTIITNDTTGDTIVPASISLVGGTDPDADGNFKTLVVANEGTWTINPTTGVATFAPLGSFTGDPTPPSYTGEDAEGNTSNESTITLTADPLPKTVNDVDTYTPGVDKDVTIITNDTTGDTIVPSTIQFTTTGIPTATLSADGKTLTVPNEGIWSVNASGVATFAPDASFTGDPTPPSYTGEDAQGNTSNESTITLTADPLPKTVNDVDTYTPGVDKDVTIITNDTTGDTIVPATILFTTTGIPTATLSADGKTLTVPNEGLWSVNASGVATFAPDASFTGDPTPPSYTGEDAQGNTSNESTITLTTDPLPKTVNDVDTYTPGVDKDVTILGNDTTGDTIVPTTVLFTTTGIPTATLSADGKTLTVPNEGIWSVNASGVATFAPDASFTGDPTPPSYTGEDAQGNTSNESTITLTADPLPKTVNDVDTYTPGVDKDVTIITNDTTGDTIVPATILFTTTGIPTATLSADGKTLTVPNEGLWSVNASGVATFAPDASFTGDPTPPSYTGEDAQGNTSNESTITLTADPLPKTVNDVDTYTPGVDKDVTIITNDTTGDTIVPASISLVGGTDPDADGNFKTLVVANEGTWTINPTTGVATFAPLGSFTGDPTPPSYTGEDAEGNTSNESTITLTADPLPKTVNDVDTYTPGVDKDVTILGNDTTGDTIVPASISLVGGTDPDADGNFKTLVVANEGTWTINPTTGVATFAPLGSFTGDPTPPSYTGEDAQGNTSNESTITLTADPLPKTVNDVDTYTPGVDKDVTIITNDTTGDTIVPSTIQFTTTGIPTATLSADGKRLTVPNEGIWSVNASGMATFAPDASFTGDPTPPSYTGEDAQGNTSNESTITLTADPLPKTVNDVDTYTPGVDKDVTIITNDTTGDTIVPASISLVGGTDPDADGNFKTLVVANEGTWTINPTTGVATFAPLGSFTGDPTPPSYTGEDAEGNTSNESTITLTADPLPKTVNDVDTYTPGVDKDVTIITNDTTGDTIVPSTIQFTTTGIPTATLSADGKTLTVPNEGIWSVNASGVATFAPDASFTGDPTPPSYTGEDAQGNTSNESTITLTADPLPKTVNDVDTYTPGVDKDVTIITNDTTGDTIVPATILFTTTGIPTATLSADGKTLTVPNEGLWSVNASGVATFAPDASFTGDPTPPSYTGEDAQGNTSNESTITLTTDPLPKTVNDVDTYTPGVDKDVTILGNDTTGDTIVPASISLVGGTDPDADGNFKTLVVANEGTWTINPTTGVATFAPLGSFTGDPTPPSYTGEDAQGNTSNESTITLTADPLPKTVNDVDTYTPGVDKDVTIITNDTTGDTIVPATILFTTTGIPTATLSADGKTLTVPNEGIWSVNASGVATFAPDASFTGDPTPPSYTGEDAQGNTSNESTITLTADPLPKTVNDVDTYTPGVDKDVTIITNDTTGDTIVPASISLVNGSNPDADGNFKTLVVANEGTWTINPTSGVATFAPLGSFTGDPTPPSYIGEDAEGNVSNASTITLTADPLPTGVVNGSVKDPSGNPIVGAKVKLVNIDGSPITGTDGNPIAEVTVDPTTGAYEFTNVPVGNYKLVETNPANHTSTGESSDQTGDPTNTSTTDDEILVTVTAGETDAANNFIDTPLATSVKMVKTVYGDDDPAIGHDSGAGCTDGRASSQAILVDINNDKKMPVTYCFEVTNTGETNLVDINITDTTLGLNQADLTLLNGPAPAVLVPGASVLYYYGGKDLTDALVNTATVVAKPVDSNGNPTGSSVSTSDSSSAEVVVIFDPPSALKTVTPSGESAMQWEMIWINPSTVTAPGVVVYDEVPEGTHFVALAAGDHVSADGVYCETRGSSTTDATFDNHCYFEQPNANYPRGRILWSGTVASDPGETTEAGADNEVVIRFTTVLNNPDLVDQKIENQATSDWDYNNDGNPEFEAPTKTPAGESKTTFKPDEVDPDTKPVDPGSKPPVNPANIPTLSEWAMLLLSLMLMLTGKFENLITGRWSKNDKGGKS